MLLPETLAIINPVFMLFMLIQAVISSLARDVFMKPLNYWMARTAAIKVW
jgi:hypothetical protein